GDDVIDDDDAFSAQPRHDVAAGSEGARNIALPSVGAEPDLLPRAPAARNDSGIDAEPGHPTDGAGQFGRLVVAPLELACPVQRHGDEHRLVPPQLAAGI